MAISNLIAVASGKGGVGKTWFSNTLCHTLARANKKVLLVDGDIGLANVDVQLGLTPEKDLANVFFSKAKLEDVVFKFESGGYDVIAGRSGSTSFSALPQDKLFEIKHQLKTIAKNYDYVILDIGAGIEAYVQFLSEMARRCIVVITDEPTSLTDAYAYVKICYKKLAKEDIHIVVNQAANQKEGKKAYESMKKACESFLMYTPDLLGVIRKDNKVKEAIRAQQPILKIAPKTLAAIDVATISVNLLKLK